MHDLKPLSTPAAKRAKRSTRLGHRFARAATGAVIGLMLVALAACSGSGSGPTAPEPVARDRQPLHVFASGTFRPLLTMVEPMFERDNPTLDLIVTFGDAHAPLDADQDLQEMIGDGAQLDVFLAGDAVQVAQISREPIRVVPWVGNRLVLVRQRGSRLRLIDLSSGTCEVAVALERTPLGRASRRALESRGIWSGIAERVGLFADGAAIARRTASPALEPVLGIVFASTARTSEHPIEVAARLESDGGNGGKVEHVVAVWTERGGRFSSWLESQIAMDAAQRAGFVVEGVSAGLNPGGNQGANLGDAAPGRGR